jgi:hypothetical protein
MTSLRSFQNEIDQIHRREVVKQRSQAAADKEQARDAKKTLVKPSTKAVAVASASDKKADKKSDIKLDIRLAPVEDATVPAIEADNDPILDQEKIQVRAVAGRMHRDLHVWLRHYCFQTKPTKLAIY